MQIADPHIFAKYEAAVRNLVLTLSKTRAIELSERAYPDLITPASIGQLYESLDCDGWKQSVGANWEWRYKEPGETDSKEVLLERAIAKQDKSRWACQMSTSSGVEGPYFHRRRAIDLVRRVGPRRYAFVELKIDSDNPLYAAFEILGYALAYLHARTQGRTGSGNHNVFDAERIELTILGPEKWYGFSERGTDKKLDEGLAWLTTVITDALNDFVKERLTSAPVFTMRFRRFPVNDPDPGRQAEYIRQDAEDWSSS